MDFRWISRDSVHFSCPRINKMCLKILKIIIFSHKILVAELEALITLLTEFVTNGYIVAEVGIIKKIKKSWIFNGFLWILSTFDRVWRLSCTLYPVSNKAKSWDTFFGSHLKGKNVGAAWLGTVKDQINIYRLKIIKNFRKTFSRF